MTLKHGFKKMLAEANASIETLAVKDALELVRDGKVRFIDIREKDEREAGTIHDSINAPSGFLELNEEPESSLNNPVFTSGDRLVLLYASGDRAAHAAEK